MHTYVDVDMQMHIFMQSVVYSCICMHGMHIALAWGALSGEPTFGGGGEGKRKGIPPRRKGKRWGIIFEIHSDLTYSCACTHDRNETISRLD